MKIKILFVFFLILISSISTFAYNLEDYPSMFEKEGVYDVNIVSPGPDKYFSLVYSILNNVLRVMPPGGFVSTPKDIDSFDQNLILIGNACENPLVDELRNYPENCREDLVRGEGKVELIERNGNYIIIVEGYDWQGLLEVSKLLAENKLFGKMDTAHADVNEDGRIGRVFLRQNRINHFMVNEKTYTLEFTEVKPNYRGVIEINGKVQEERNAVCPYTNNYNHNPEVSNFVIITVDECTEKLPQETIVDFDKEKSDEIDNLENKEFANNEISKEDRIDDESEIKKEKNNIFIRFINWIKNLF